MLERDFMHMCSCSASKEARLKAQFIPTEFSWPESVEGCTAKGLQDTTQHDCQVGLR